MGHKTLFNIFSAPRCMQKVMQVEEFEYDTRVKCSHVYKKRCYNTYVTEYRPHKVGEIRLDSFPYTVYAKKGLFFLATGIDESNSTVICLRPQFSFFLFQKKMRTKDIFFMITKKVF